MIYFLLVFTSLVPYRYIGFDFYSIWGQIAFLVHILPLVISGLLALLWCLSITDWRNLLFKSYYGPGICYLILSFLSSFSAPDLFFSLSRSTYYGLTGVVIYFIVNESFTSQDSRIALGRFIVCIGCIIAGIGVVEFVVNYNPWEKSIFNLSNPLFARFAGQTIEKDRILSTLGHPVFVGSYLVACIPFTFVFYERSNTLSAKLVYVMCFMVMICALFFTFSRGAWVGFAVSLIIFYQKRKKRLTVILLSLMLCTPLFFSNQIERIWEKTRSGYILNFSENSRVIAYGHSASILVHHLLFGVGTGQYRAFSHAKGALDDTPDNMYLRLLVEGGFLGLICIVSLVIYILKPLWRIRNQGKKESMASGILASLIGVCVDLITCDALYFSASRILFWVLCGLAGSIAYSTPQGSKNRTTPVGVFESDCPSN